MTPGQSYTTVQGGEAVFATSVLEVEVSEEIVGSSGQTPDGTAYLQIRHPAFVGHGSEGDARQPYDLDAFADTVPIGAPVALFVYDIADSVEPGLIIDEGAGRPRNAALLSAAVQGFWIDPTGRDLTSVFESVEAMGDGWGGIGSLEDLEAEINGSH